MHEDYRDPKLKELRDQLTRFAPKAKKVEQAGLAEKIYGEIESDRSYAFDYVCFRITNYRPEASSRHSIASADLKHDLRLLIEDLSDSADVAITEVAEPVHTVDELSRMFSVCTGSSLLDRPSSWLDSTQISRERAVRGIRNKAGRLPDGQRRVILRELSQFETNECAK